ncbi:MAG: glycerate kinase [Dehalococcoidia bacterium SM23_28_2]|nr:MAG: glycerate kinase [Dehalococcoidia bacterium SM23_28_2]
MKIVVAPQEFKGSLTAVQAAQAMADGLRRVLPDAALELVPMADGGPGTVEAVVTAAENGRRMTAAAHDALGRPLEAAWGVIDGDTAVIEMAAASGLTLLTEDERDPCVASTYGTGEIIRAALDAGCRRIIVGIGGSSTNDAGAGMAQALGARLLDDAGQDLPPGGAALARLGRIDASGLDPRLRQCRVLAATDVFNPLCGPQGASLLYGPQKGATPEVARELDAALRHYAQVVERDLGVSVLDLAGAGAAGGLGAGLAAFLNAELVLGAQLVAEAVGLRRRLEGADLALTGEGRLDAQTSFGKAPLEVARLARDCGLPVIAIAGSLTEDCRPALGEAFDAFVAITPRTMSVGEAMAQAAELVTDAAEGVARLLLVGQRLGRR